MTRQNIADKQTLASPVPSDRADGFASAISPVGAPKKLSIAICGTRGIPACYGGFETFAEELSTRLVKLGYRVVVYGRRHVIDFRDPTYRGVELRLLPAPRQKYLETPVHSFLSFLDLVRRPVDVVVLCNAANSPFAWIPRLFGMPVVINVDGIERKRAKWNFLGRTWYRLGEWCSVLFGSVVVADAECIREYYLNRYSQESRVIRYGYRELRAELVTAKLQEAELKWTPAEEAVFERFGLTPGAYWLYVSRLEPENNAHLVVSAYARLPEDLKHLPLVIVGDAPYASEYISALKSGAPEGVRFLGYQFGEVYETLQLGAWSYIQATEVGGTHPALVEAMGFGNCIIATDVPEHREVLGEAGLYFSRGSATELNKQMQYLLETPSAVAQYRTQAARRGGELFSWNRIVSDYEELISSFAKFSRST